MQVSGNQIKGWVDGELLFDIVDEENPLLDGGVAYVVEQGHSSSEGMIVKPLNK